jgi:signal peptidase I
MEKKKESKTAPMMWILYALLVVSIIAYAIDNNAALGIFVFALIVLTLYLELRDSLKHEGARKTAVEIGATLGGVLLLWIILIVVLQSTSPVDVVSSCSMLPVLHRGDIVFLHGISNFSSFFMQNHLSVVNVSPAAYQEMLNNIQNEDLAFYPYLNGDKSQIIGDDIVPNGVNFSVGLYSFVCIDNYITSGEDSLIQRCYLPENPSSNLIKYGYSVGKVDVNNTLYNIVYTSSISIGGVNVSANYSTPIIVYRTVPGDSFYAEGDIIHRIFAVIRTGNSYHVLTKGDNNAELDLEVGNYPANQSQVLGYVVGPQIPFLGYIKLILSGLVASPLGCNQTAEH